ncbi:MAG: DUF167 domain-containing protein [Dehalococcoidia bacterium]|nr:MAG: DUF167 domain-containing protein [Dehalococcoidia bacterium]
MAGEERSRIMAHIQPNAGRSEVMGFRAGVLQVRIAAPPIKGKANDELMRLLSDVLGVSKSNLAIEKGVTSRKKTIIITGLGQDRVVKLLEGH